MPADYATTGMESFQPKSLAEIKPGDLIKRVSSMDAYAVDTDVEKFRTGDGVLASRRVVITENDLPAWRVFRPAK